MSKQPPHPQTDAEKKLAQLFQQLTTEEKPAHKEMEEYKFWKTQPVPKFDESVAQEGPIENKSVDEIPAEPYKMLPQFEWVTMDLTDSTQLAQVHDLLFEHYVEDSGEGMRFGYTTPFFNYALKPPGWRKDWHVGVRVKGTGRLVAFISAIPARLRVRKNSFKAVEINFLCVHKKLRNKRLAPLLIKEITRRVNRCDIWQALYTAGAVLPAPVAACRYMHRPLNWENLYEVGFSRLPKGQTRAGMVARYAVARQTKTKGLRRMVKADLAAVFKMYCDFQARFELVQELTQDELAHWLLGGVEQETLEDKDKSVVAYVVETDGVITDFFSFYLLPFTILNNKLHDRLGVAYLYYYGSTVSDAELPRRLQSLVSDAIVIAKGLGVDVFNALTTQQNNLFLKELKFGQGDGMLKYYLFNYKTFPVDGGCDKDNVPTGKKSGVGVVLL